MSGSIHIEQYYVERRASRNVKRLAAVSRQRHLMALFMERLFQQFGHSPLVLDDQNLHIRDRNKES